MIRMFPQLALFAVFCGLALAGLAFSSFALWRARMVLREAERPKPRDGAAVAALDSRLEALQVEMAELRRQARAHSASGPMAVKPGLNVEKRSQALRMSRRGARPEEIASALEIPAQEVDLLLKIHRIVLSNI